jgi:hypothetical protein
MKKTRGIGGGADQSTGRSASIVVCVREFQARSLVGDNESTPRLQVMGSTEVLAWRTAAGFPRKPAGEGIVTDCPAKMPRLRLDQERTSAASRHRRLSRTCYLLGLADREVAICAAV